MIAHKAFINIENQSRFRARLQFGLVNSMTLLPKKFGGAQKKARSHFPADNVRPLIDQDGKIAI